MVVQDYSKLHLNHNKTHKMFFVAIYSLNFDSSSFIQLKNELYYYSKIGIFYQDYQLFKHKHSCYEKK